MRFPLFLVALGLSGALAAPLVAQNGAPPPPDAAQPVPDQPIGNAPAATPLTAPGKDAPGNKDASANRRAQTEARLRSLMNEFGLTDALKQDALIAYLAEDETGKAALRDAARRLMSAVRRGATPERTRDLIAVYKAALSADKERRAAAQIALDAKIGYSLDPRLEAGLWLFGVLGDGAPAASYGWTPGRSASKRPDNLPRTDGFPRPDGFPRGDTSVRRSGVAFGIVAAKGDNWLEVRSEGASERYAVSEAPAIAPNPAATNAAATTTTATSATATSVIATTAAASSPTAVLQTLSALKIGDRVRVEWMGSGRKRLLQLELWTAPFPLAPRDAPAPPDNPAN